MNIETLKEIITNKLNTIRLQAAIATNEGKLDECLKLADEEKEVLHILEKLNQ